MDHIPVTAVGKIFKPELRLDATRRVLSDSLADLGQQVEITVSSDAQYGMTAQIHIHQPRDDWDAQAQQRLSQFKLQYTLLSTP